MDRKLLKTVQTITTFRNPLADPVGTRRGPPLVRGPQFENRCTKQPFWDRPGVLEDKALVETTLSSASFLAAFIQHSEHQ